MKEIDEKDRILLEELHFFGGWWFPVLNKPNRPELPIGREDRIERSKRDFHRISRQQRQGVSYLQQQNMRARNG